MLALVAQAVALASTAHAAFPGRNGPLLFDTCGQPLVDDQLVRWHLVDADGRHLRTIRKFPFAPGAFPCDVAYDPSWSPDGRRVLYESGDTIKWSDPHGRHVHTVARAARMPAWSPTGRRVAFEYYVQDRLVNCRLGTLRLDGSGRRLLTPWVAEVSWPSWRADGRLIAFDEYRQDRSPPDHVLVARADGHGTRDIGPGRNPDWSPDGRLIAFTDFHNVWTMRPDGSHRRRLTHYSERTEVHTVKWSPDGRWIAFIRRPNRDAYDDEIRRIRRDGHHDRVVLDTHGWGRIANSISWRPR